MMAVQEFARASEAKRRQTKQSSDIKEDTNLKRNRACDREVLPEQSVKKSNRRPRKRKINQNKAEDHSPIKKAKIYERPWIESLFRRCLLSMVDFAKEKPSTKVSDQEVIDDIKAMNTDSNFWVLDDETSEALSSKNTECMSDEGSTVASGTGFDEMETPPIRSPITNTPPKIRTEFANLKMPSVTYELSSESWVVKWSESATAKQQKKQFNARVFGFNNAKAASFCLLSSVIEMTEKLSSQSLGRSCRTRVVRKMI
eukprot:GHVP01013583.1.p1 GENE.GHVP01013583.1~~GHVP01013583.1.p1  ORF type:complete len:257 (-),score=42.39 GHVP01013583.1:72-842(-)